MVRMILLLALVPPTVAASPVGTAGLQSLPTGKGLPVLVRTALFFNHVETFDDNQGTFEATTDLRLTWEDPRLRYPAAEGLHGYKEYRFSAAEAEIARIWTPTIRFVNRLGEPSLVERRLRVMPNGEVELITRTTAVYKVPVDVARFPFDHQPLQVEIAVDEATVEVIDLIFRREDVDFTRASRELSIDGWTPGLVNLRRDVIKGWNGDRYAKIIMTLDVRRLAGGTVSTIFIPLFASLLIPFMATWMNRADEEGGFDVEAFELANVVIGGLFAVIALSFSIGAAYPAVAAVDNTVTRLIALNYVALAIGLMITVAFYRYRLPACWFGPFVQKELFRFISWAVPVVFVVTGLALVLASAA
jgi:hypothetical protein